MPENEYFSQISQWYQVVGSFTRDALTIQHKCKKNTHNLMQYYQLNCSAVMVRNPHYWCSIVQRTLPRADLSSHPATSENVHLPVCTSICILLPMPPALYAPVPECGNTKCLGSAWWAHMLWISLKAASISSRRALYCSLEYSSSSARTPRVPQGSPAHKTHQSMP